MHILSCVLSSSWGVLDGRKSGASCARALLMKDIAPQPHHNAIRIQQTAQGGPLTLALIYVGNLVM